MNSDWWAIFSTITSSVSSLQSTTCGNLMVLFSRALNWTELNWTEEILLFTTLDLASITSHIHNWVFCLLWLHLFILSGVKYSPVAYWASTDLGSSSFSVRCFAFPCCAWDSQRLLKWFALVFSSGPCFELSFFKSGYDWPIYKIMLVPGVEQWFLYLIGFKEKW